MHRFLRFSCFVIFGYLPLQLNNISWLFAALRYGEEEAVRESWAENEFWGEAKKKKLIFCCCSNVQFTKNRIYWPLTLSRNTFIVSFKHIQPTSQFFKYFLFSCAVSRLFRLDCLCFFFFTKKISAVVILQCFSQRRRTPSCSHAISKVEAKACCFVIICERLKRQDMTWTFDDISGKSFHTP